MDIENRSKQLDLVVERLIKLDLPVMAGLVAEASKELAELRAYKEAAESQKPTHIIDWEFDDDPDDADARGDLIIHQLNGAEYPAGTPLYANPVPADKPAVGWPQINELVTRFIDDYRYAGDVGYYCPSEREKTLIADCVAGLLDELPIKPAAVVPECFKKLYDHARGMRFGTDWNNGTAARRNRQPLIDATWECEKWLSAAPAHIQQSASTDDLAQRLLGRAEFLRDRGEIKTPELLERAANAIR